MKHVTTHHATPDSARQDPIKPPARKIHRQHPDDYRAWLHGLFARAQRAALDRFDGTPDKTERTASRLAELQLQALCEEEGGDDIYLPAPDKTARNATICAEFNGTNHEEVCRRHGIGRSRLYEIVAERTRWCSGNPRIAPKTARSDA